MGKITGKKVQPRAVLQEETRGEEQDQQEEAGTSLPRTSTSCWMSLRNISLLELKF
jgi:hypothetical protein